MDSSSVPRTHAFLVSFPGQGHINPLLRLGNLLASKGLLVTLSAPETIGQRLRKTNNISDQPTRFGDGMIRFEFFDDEYKLDKDKAFDMGLYMDHLEAAGKKILPQLIKTNGEQGRPVSCLVYNSFIPWVSDVAQILHIPCAALWVQSCASFSAYYHYHHSLVPFPTDSNPEIDVPLPSMPLLRYDEVPSFLLPYTPYLFLRRAILGQLKNLSNNSCILLDTFQELENEVIQYMAKFCPIKPIGPLFKYPHYNAPSSDIVSADLIKADDCTEWLDSKPPFSVVYICFGSVVNLKQEQATEIAYGLMNSGLPFLWVLRPPYEEVPTEPLVLPDDFKVKVGDKGRVVQWSQQQRVLAHPSIASFMTHCGWNSMLEALANGVPVLAFPQWGDQVTNAKYLVDEFKVGIRMCRGEAENRIVPREKVTKCLLEATSGPKAAEVRENAANWKKRAEDAVAEGGSSDWNIQEFLNELTLKWKIQQ